MYEVWPSPMGGGQTLPFDLIIVGRGRSAVTDRVSIEQDSMSAKGGPVFDAGLADGTGASEPCAAVPHQGAAFALLGTIQAALTAALSLVLLALPAIQDDLGLSRANLVLVTAGPGLAFSGLLLLGGRLADMVGRRRTFIVGLIIFGAASAVAGLAPSAELLLAARFAQGCGAALVAPAAMALLSDVFPDPLARDRAVAIWGNLSPVGATAGTLLSGLIVTWGRGAGPSPFRSSSR